MFVNKYDKWYYDEEAASYVEYKNCHSSIWFFVVISRDQGT